MFGEGPLEPFDGFDIDHQSWPFDNVVNSQVLCGCSLDFVEVATGSSQALGDFVLSSNKESFSPPKLF